MTYDHTSPRDCLNIVAVDGGWCATLPEYGVSSGAHWCPLVAAWHAVRAARWVMKQESEGDE